MDKMRPVRFEIAEDLWLELLHPARSGELFQLIDENREYLRRWLPWIDQTQTIEDTKPFLETSWSGYLRGEGFSLGICHSDELAGIIGFHAFDRAHRVTSLGYWLSEAHTGQGLMTRSVERCLDFAFEGQDMNRVYLRCATENTPSRRIAKHLGFQHEGRQREAEWLYDHFVDLEVYAMLKREWLELRLNRST